MRLPWSKRYFTFWHHRRTPSYTASKRKRMEKGRKVYLSHLKRWLNYKVDSSSTPIEPFSTDDPSLDGIANSAVANEQTRVTPGVDGTPVSNRDDDPGEVSRMQSEFPLPSCAREDGDEQDANGPSGSSSGEPGFFTKVKRALGFTRR